MTTNVLDPDAIEALVHGPEAGAIATFTGVVRDNTDGVPTTFLEYEAYAEMAEAEMRRIGESVYRRWPGVKVAGFHRIGQLGLSEASVVICAAASDGGAAMEACHYFIDELKERVPVWKKEFRSDGAFWVEGPNRVRTGR